jgi:3-oxoacyl-[acyl-carrier protein] reductase
MRLAGKAVLVTGGTGGIGRATAIAFGREGARVALTYHGNAEEVETVCKEVEDAGGEAFPVPMDLSDLASVESSVSAVTEHWSGLDVFVGNAVNRGSITSAADLPMRIEDADLNYWQEIIRANLEGNFRAIQVAAPALRRSDAGRVVLVSSGTAEYGQAGGGPYGAAKAGLHGLMASLARDLGADGGLVNIVMPGITLDNGHHNAISDEHLPAIAGRLPARRLPSTQDVAAIIVFLSSPVNGAITGEIIRVTGGTPART